MKVIGQGRYNTNINVNITPRYNWYSYYLGYFGPDHDKSLRVTGYDGNNENEYRQLSNSKKCVRCVKK
jgi:hypothetical protein